MLNLQKGEYHQDNEAWSEGLQTTRIWEPDTEQELEADLEELASSNPQAIVIKSHFLSDERMATLLMSSELSNLEVLNLHACEEVGDYTAAALAQGGLPKLKRLCINWTKISDRGLLLLAKNCGAHLTDLQGVHLANATEAGLLQVQASPIANAYVTCPAD